MKNTNNFEELKKVGKITKEWEQICNQYPFDEGKNFLQLDGIIDKNKWNNAPIKILFILKESYRKGSKDEGENGQYISDMPQKIIKWEKENGLFDTYKNVDKWAKNITKTICNEEYTITSTAIINVSKCGLFNESSTKKSTLKNALKKIGNVKKSV